MSTAFGYVGDDILKHRTEVSLDDVKTAQAVMDDFESKTKAAVETMLDSTSKLHGYGNIVSACSYAGGNNPFQKESQQFIAWRGAVWLSLYDYARDVRTGVRPIPSSIEEVLSTLPTYESFYVP